MKDLCYQQDSTATVAKEHKQVNMRRSKKRTDENFNDMLRSVINLNSQISDV